MQQQPSASPLAPFLPPVQLHGGSHLISQEEPACRLHDDVHTEFFTDGRMFGTWNPEVHINVTERSRVFTVLNADQMIDT